MKKNNNFRSIQDLLLMTFKSPKMSGTIFFHSLELDLLGRVFHIDSQDWFIFLLTLYLNKIFFLYLIHVFGSFHEFKNNVSSVIFFVNLKLFT